jgi:poly(A) polymerase
VRDAGPLLGELNVLTRCDCTTRNERKAAELSKRMDELEERIGELAELEELASIRPELDGTQVMKQLGIGPGPLIGKALAFLLEIRLEEGMLGNDEIRRRLDQWRIDHGGC